MRFAAGAAGAFLLLTSGCHSGPQVGSEVVAFEATDADGDQVSFAAYEGQVVVLYFFGFQ